MKKYRMILILALTAAMAASLMSGCGKKKPADADDTVVDVEEEADNAEDAAEESEDLSDETTGSDLDEDGNEGVTPPEAYPDYDGPSAEDMEVTNESKSEGLNAVPGEPVDLMDSALFGIVGETYSIPEENTHFTLTVNDIGLTDRLTSDQEANRVVRITYTYSNIDL